MSCCPHDRPKLAVDSASLPSTPRLYSLARGRQVSTYMPRTTYSIYTYAICTTCCLVYAVYMETLKRAISVMRGARTAATAATAGMLSVERVLRCYACVLRLQAKLDRQAGILRVLGAVRSRQLLIAVVRYLLETVKPSNIGYVSQASLHVDLVCEQSQGSIVRVVSRVEDGVCI